MIPAWLARLGLGAGASYLKRRLKGKGKEAAGEIRKKMLAKIAKERDKYMPEHLKEKAKKIEFYHPVKNAKEAQKFIKDVLGDKKGTGVMPKTQKAAESLSKETARLKENLRKFRVKIKKGKIKRKSNEPDTSTSSKRKAVIGGLKNVLKGAEKHHDKIVPPIALATGGTLKYIKESKRKKSKSKRNRPDLYPPPKKKKK